MEHVATQRLIDAAATLEPADRALLNMWVNQGLDDRRISALAAIDAVTLAARRDRIVQRLGARLGLPLADVRAALAEIAASSRQADARAIDESTKDRRGATTPPSGGVDAAVPTHRRAWSAIAAVVVIASVVIVLIVVLSPSGGSHRSAALRAPAQSHDSARTSSATTAALSARTTGAGTSLTTSSATAKPAARSVEPRPVAGAASSERVVRLPGVTTRMSGWVGLIGSTRRRRLGLSVRLPSSTRGHFEAWLYSSIVDSRPLGALRAGTHTVVFTLPHDARRYRWIDISFQPNGVVSHSGESRIRAPNPLRRRAGGRPRSPRGS